MISDSLAKINDASALPVRGNEIAVHQTLSFQPYEAGGVVMVMLENYPDGRERLSGIDTCRVCAVNRGEGNLTAANRSNAQSHHRTDESSYLVLFILLPCSLLHRHLSRHDKREKRRQDWRCFR